MDYDSIHNGIGSNIENYLLISSINKIDEIVVNKQVYNLILIITNDRKVFKVDQNNNMYANINIEFNKEEIVYPCLLLFGKSLDNSFSELKVGK